MLPFFYRFVSILKCSIIFVSSIYRMYTIILAPYSYSCRVYSEYYQRMITMCYVDNASNSGNENEGLRHASLNQQVTSRRNIRRHRKSNRYSRFKSTKTHLLAVETKVGRLICERRAGRSFSTNSQGNCCRLYSLESTV